MRQGCKTDVKLGHATRVLGIHDKVAALDADGADAA